MEAAVETGLAIEEQENTGLSPHERKKLFTWLTVTNKGAARVNAAAVALLWRKAEAQGEPIVPANSSGDRSISRERMWLWRGMKVRLTKNLDKALCCGFLKRLIEFQTEDNINSKII